MFDSLTVQDIDLELSRRNLLSMIQQTFKGNYVVNWHHKIVCRELTNFIKRLLAGDKSLKNLMILMPPRHGKSEIISRRFPAFCFGLNPDLFYISICHSASLSQSMNRQLQQCMLSSQFNKIFPKTRLSDKNVRKTSEYTYLRNSDVFEIVEHRGRYVNAGIMGGVNGEGANILSIDDIFKGAEQARSYTLRKKLEETYDAVLYPRLEQNGKVVFTYTPWHAEDLGMRLLQREPEKWKVIKFPAIYDSGLKNLHPEDPRKDGEVLWPWKKDTEELEQIKNLLGHWWNALYQCSPVFVGGNLVPVNSFQLYDNPLALFDGIYQSWDTGQKAEDRHNPSACLTFGVKGIYIYILDLFLEKMEYPQLKQAIRAQHNKWNPQTILIEDKSSGSSAIQELSPGQKQLDALPIVPIIPEGDKVTRMERTTDIIDAKCVFIPRNASWTKEFLRILEQFPESDIKDPVDALSQFLAWHRNRNTELQYISVVKRKILNDKF